MPVLKCSNTGQGLPQKKEKIRYKKQQDQRSCLLNKPSMSFKMAMPVQILLRNVQERNCPTLSFPPTRGDSPSLLPPAHLSQPTCSCVDLTRPVLGSGVCGPAPPHWLDPQSKIMKQHSKTSSINKIHKNSTI